MQATKDTTLLDEYIKTVTAGKPVFEIEIPHDENAIHDLFFPEQKGCDGVVLEDSDKLDECLQARLSSIHANAVVEDLTDRVRSGTLNADLDGDTPPPMMEFFTSRIATMLEKRRTKLATEKLVWFNMREDEQGHMLLSWPLSGYMPISAGMIFHDLKVQKACHRLKQRQHIKNVRVTGSVIPSAISVYFDWVWVL